MRVFVKTCDRDHVKTHAKTYEAAHVRTCLRAWLLRALVKACDRVHVRAYERSLMRAFVSVF